MSLHRLLVINPNSNQSVTQGIDSAIDSFRQANTFEINCSTLEKGPFGIETDEDIELVLPIIVSEILSNKDNYDAFIIACYSDPAIAESRAVSNKPVLGIHESAVSLCASYGRKFGVLALGRESIQRHIRYVRKLGLGDFHAGERPLGLSVDEAANDPASLSRIVETGRELVDEDGAEMLILGCAGLAKHRRVAQEKLGVPVIDPVQAAVLMATQSFQ